MVTNFLRDLQIVPEEGLHGGNGGVLAGAVSGHGNHIALLDAHTHQLHQLGGLNGIAILGNSDGGIGKVFGGLSQHAGGTGVDAQGIVDGVLKLLNNCNLRFYLSF